MVRHFKLMKIFFFITLVFTGSIYAGDIKSVVIHLGDQKITAGFGGESQPRVTLPAVVGYPKSQTTRPMMGMGMGMSSQPVFGDTALQKASQYNLSYAMQGRQVTNIKDFEKLMNHVLRSLLNVEPDEVKILVLDADSKSMREQVTRMFFESLGTRYLFLMNQNVSWQQASKTSVDAAFYEMYFTKDEYDENGASAIHAKFR
ncbi:MAG: hypothetical protein KDK41_13935 [Leptospiraceae bacterium]|nr:hypothetical protein [Leptospiraceae bacterium]